MVDKPLLTGLTERERAAAWRRFQIIQPYLEGRFSAKSRRPGARGLLPDGTTVGPSLSTRRAGWPGTQAPPGREPTPDRDGVAANHRGIGFAEDAPFRGGHLPPSGGDRAAAGMASPQLQHRLQPCPRARSRPGSVGPRGHPGLSAALSTCSSDVKPSAPTNSGRPITPCWTSGSWTIVARPPDPG